MTLLDEEPPPKGVPSAALSESVLTRFELLTIDEVAQRCRTSTKTISRYISNGSLPALKVMSRWRIVAEDLQDFLESSRWKPAAEAPRKGNRVREPAPQPPPQEGYQSTKTLLAHLATVTMRANLFKNESERLALLAREAGASFEEIAAAASVTPQTIKNWLRGTRHG